MSRFLAWITRHRWLALTVLGLLSAAFLASALRGVFASSLENLFLGEDPEYEIYKERIRQFASDRVYLVAYPDPDPLSSRSLERLQKAIRAIERIPEVAHTDSLLTAQRFGQEDGSLTIERYSRLAKRHPERATALLQEMIADPLLGKVLLSPDGQHAAVLIELTVDNNRAMERLPHLIADTVSGFTSAGFARADLHLVGLVTSMAEVIEQSRANLFRLFPLVCLALLLTLYLLFNRFWPVFITMTVSAVAVIWTMGFAVLLDPQINIFVAMIPSVILIVATSDVIHLCSAYMLELARGKSKPEAISSSGQDVGKACLLTSATTFVGFASLALIPVPAFRLLGFILAFGVAVALLIAITLTPILFCLMPAPKPWHDEVSLAQRGLTQVLRRLEELSTRHPWPVIFAFGLLLAVSLAGLSRLHIETDFNKRFATDNPVRLDEEYFRRHFAGSNFLEVFIEAEKEGGLLEPAVFNRMFQLEKAIEALPEVDTVLSLADIIMQIDRKMANRAVLPEQAVTRALLAQYLLLFEMSGGEDLERMLDFGRARTRLSVRLNDNAVRATYALGQRIDSLARRILPAGVSARPSGLVYLLGGFMDRVVDGQKRGLLFAFVSILAMMAIGLGSFRIGVLSMIPNALPILALGGLLGFSFDQVDSDNIAIALIAIGIGVDDTIHFLLRLKFESGKADDEASPLQRAFHFSGRAILITSIILVLGFAPFALSSYISIRLIGLLIPFTLIVALAADVLLVPAMVQLGAIRFNRERGS